MNRKKRVFTCVLCIIFSVFLLTACSSSEGNTNQPEPTGGELKPTEGGTSNTTGSSSGTETKEEATPIPAQKLSFEEIEKLAAERVFHVHWYTMDGDFSAGTPFFIDSDVHKEKLLVTAFHFLVPDEDNDFTGDSLPQYMLGGSVSYAKTGADTGATLKNCLVISDAAPVPKVEKDVAAFTVQGADALPTLPLSTHPVSMGDKLYLLANLWDTTDVHENCVYECQAILDQNGTLAFKLDPIYGTTGASGGPIVNEYGEVVAIHMASSQDGKILYAHSTESFMKQINEASIASGITYPSDLSSLKSDDSDDIPQIYHEYGDTAETYFFNAKVTGAEFSDKIGDTTAPEGFKYLTVDLDVDTTGITESDINLYYYDFAVIWEDNYAMASQDFESSGSLGESQEIKANSLNHIKVTFEVASESSYYILFYEDYYYDEAKGSVDDGMVILGDHYFKVFPES